MHIIKHETTPITAVRLDVCVELPSSSHVPEFLAYIRAYGKSGVIVDSGGNQRLVHNTEKAKRVENVRELVLTIADEPGGLTHAQILKATAELGYSIKLNTIGSAISTLKKEGKIMAIGTARKETGRSVFIYRTVKPQ
jgi:hypothetical protein